MFETKRKIIKINVKKVWNLCENTWNTIWSISSCFALILTLSVLNWNQLFKLHWSKSEMKETLSEKLHETFFLISFNSIVTNYTLLECLERVYGELLNSKWLV